MSAIIYLLQVSACMALFYGFYYFMLNRLTFFTINRYYLLFTMLISFVIPLLTIHLHQQDNYPRVMQQVVYVNTLQNLPVYTPIAPVHKVIAAPAISWPQFLKTIYLLAVITLLVHLLLTLINFFARLRNGKIDRIGHVNIMRGSKNLANGSFLNYIFLSDDELSADELQQIIAHEMLHIKLLHSVDRIVAKIIQIILWFNPFIYLYVRSIEENHEFEVDREIARSTDKNNYAELLLHLSVARGGMLYHSFSKVPLKKRIIMLFNKPSAKVKRILYLLVIPVVVISCLAFARLKKDNKKPVDTKLYSVVTGAEYNGKDPVVLIDGKVYPSAILYKISKPCLNGSSSGPGNAIDIKKYGPRAKDGVVKIKTENGKITYMTPFEKEILKENSVKEAAVPVTKFYTRLILKKDNGKPYDEIIIHFKVGSETSGNEHNAKVAFFIDGKRYSEDYIKKLSPAVTATLGGGGVDNPKIHPHRWPNVADCESVIYFESFKDAPKDKPEPPQQKKDAKAETPEKVQHPFSVINLDGVGLHPLLLIDGKACPDYVLYLINRACISSFKVVKPAVSAIRYKRYGTRVKDGVIDITTKNHKIVFNDKVVFAPSSPLVRFNPSVRNNQSKVNRALVYLWDNNITGCEKCLDSITNKYELFNALNEVAWQSALEGKNLKFVEKLSKRSVDIVNDLLKYPVAGQYGTVEQARINLTGYTFMVGDTYAYILYKEGRYAEALKIQQPLYNNVKNKNGPVSEHYAEILAANHNYTKAKEVAEECIKLGFISIELETALKESYIKIHGSDKGYNEYLAGLNANKPSMQEWVKSVTLNQQAQKQSTGLAPPVPVISPPGSAGVFKPGPINYRPKGDAALAYLRDNNIVECEKTLASITDKNELLFALNEVAWQSAVEDKNLGYAEKLSKQSVDIVNSLSEHPVAGPYSTVEETRVKLRDETFMVVDTYAYILYKEGKYAEALKVQQPLYDMIINRRGSPVVEHYAEILAANNNYTKAKEVAEICFKTGYVSRELETALKESYIKINGSDKGYDEYLAGLEANSNSGMLQHLAKDIMLNQQAQKQSPEVSKNQIKFDSSLKVVKTRMQNEMERMNVRVSNTMNRTDTVEYNARDYHVKPTDHLIDLLKLLPGVKIDDKNDVFFPGGLINKIILIIIGPTGTGEAMIKSDLQGTIANFPADRVIEVRIINPVGNDPNRKPSMDILARMPTTGRASYMTDTIEFNARNYNVKPPELLSSFLRRLPGFTVDDYMNAFYNGRKINTITVNKREFMNNNTAITVTALRAIIIDRVQIINPDSNSSDRMISMNIQTKPAYNELKGF